MWLEKDCRHAYWAEVGTDTLRYWDIEKKRQVKAYKVPWAFDRHDWIAGSGDQRVLLLGSAKKLRVWDIAQARIVSEIERGEGSPIGQFSQDGRRMWGAKIHS